MSKTKAAPRGPILGDALAAPADRITADWQRSNATYLAGRANIDAADNAANEAERKWGVGRLRLLVDAEWREKFDRQRLKLNQAIRTGDLEDVRREAARMIAAWRKLDALAVEAGAAPVSPRVVEGVGSTGVVVAVCASVDDAAAVIASGRKVSVYTVDEIARLVEAFPEIVAAKKTFPGATVERIGKTIQDPIEAVEAFDDSIPF